MNETERKALAARISALQDELAVLRLQMAGGGLVCLKIAAATCGYSSEAIRLWAVSGRVSAVRQGGRWGVDLNSAVAYATRCRAGGAA